jgi:hypothetical protein
MNTNMMMKKSTTMMKTSYKYCSNYTLWLVMKGL